MGGAIDRASWIACLALALAANGCGLVHERSGDATDAGPPPLGDAFFVRPDAFVPPNDAWSPAFAIAPHGPETILPDQGGPHITHPQLVVITYADDPRRASIEAHARWLVSSRWLTSVGAEYGVGAGSILGIVERADNAPSTISGPAIAASISAGIANRTLPAPSGGALDAVIYIAYFPAQTTITDMLLGTSCAPFAGYHEAGAMPDGRRFIYAVVATCMTPTMWLTDVEQQQLTAAHEVIEAATDADPINAPALQLSTMSGPLSPWAAVGGEVADLCELRQGPFAFARESGFIGSLVWSNAAARLGDRDPCAPSDVAVPYYAVSVTPDSAQPVAAGSSTTFDVLGWSTAPVASFGVGAFGFRASTSPTFFMPDATIDRSTLNNGLHATLTIRVPPGTPSGAYGLTYVALSDTTGASDLFPVLVYVP